MAFECIFDRFLGVSFGGLMTMASYNDFQNNILRDTLIVTLGNCFSSVFAGFGVFSFLGHLAYRIIFLTIRQFSIRGD